MKSKQQGATLIEVLIAAVILGIGLMGIALMQAKALQNLSESHYRTTATEISWMISERIRANLPAIEHYITNLVQDCTTPPQKTCAMKPTDTAVAPVCTPGEIATYDLYEAGCLGVMDTLPEGVLNINLIEPEIPDFIARLNIEILWKTRSRMTGKAHMKERFTM